MNTRGKKNERGATAVEYGLILAGLIILAIVLPLLGEALSVMFESQACNEDLGYHCS